MNIKLLLGDCLQKLKELEDNSVDSVVTDPPYELGFMGKGWDSSGIAFNKEVWEQCLRVLKPGGHLLAFGGTRTYHRMTVAIEDAGFEIRDCIFWCYGSGFPKSHNIGKAVDKILGNEREVVGENPNHRESKETDKTWQNQLHTSDGTITKGNSPYEGWGTALKPAHEPIVMARKPFKGSVAENVLKNGVGGINVDACRIDTNDYLGGGTMGGMFGNGKEASKPEAGSIGRFPANVILDEEAGKILDEQSGTLNKSYEANSGGASRFFYCPKASKKDRNEGDITNQHPTVKPTDLMAYLIRLVTPKGGTVLDPFMGSGSTGKASVREGMNFIGIEREKEYMEISKARIEHEQNKNTLNKFI